MFNIKNYLEKFSKSIQSNEVDKNIVLEVLYKEVQIQLNPEDIEVKNYIIYINSSPAVKNKIFIYKNKVLDEISKTTYSKIIDIR